MSTTQINNDNDDYYDHGCVIANARMAPGLETILLRCASTDPLATKVADEKDSWSPVEQAILQQTGLVLDLRSPSERNESQAQTWMAHNGGFQAQELDVNTYHSESSLQKLLIRYPKLVLRLDILSPAKFMDYLEQTWLSYSDKMKANMFKLMDGRKLHELRMQTLNQKGLLGLNEAILETGKEGICTALKAITLHLERLLQQQPIMMEKEDGKNKSNNSYYSNKLVVIHCVQGKDRTGLLVMLCQSLMGVSEEQIIEDYYKSHYHKDRKKLSKDSSTEKNAANDDTTSAAMERATATSNQNAPQQVQVQQQSTSSSAGRVDNSTTKLDRSIFHSAPREVMADTLKYCQKEYGSVVPGYLNHIGFDNTWQRRFQQAMEALTISNTTDDGCSSSVNVVLNKIQSKL